MPFKCSIHFTENSADNLVTMVLCTGCQGPVGEKRGRVVHCSILEGGGCLACKEGIDIELEFQERRRKIRTKMNENHDPFILKLPPEVASYIFLLSMGERDTFYISCRKTGLPTPFLLGAVCSGWRQLARSTPALWARLTFTLPLPNSKIMEALPYLVSDWLERSGDLPLTLKVFLSTYSNPSPDIGHASVIDVLNQHSRRWCDVEFNLPPDYIGRLCGSSPPEKLRELSIFLGNGNTHNLPLTFRLNARPGPTKFTIWGFLLKGVDVAWDNLAHLYLNHTTLDGVLQVIQDAPLLEICSLSFISSPIDDFRIPEIIIPHPYLRTLQVSSIDETDVFQKLIKSLELPSLESWSVRSVELEESVVVDIMISFLKRSGCSLKTLDIRPNGAPADEDFERFLQAVPCLQHLCVTCPYVESSILVMDNILQLISASPPRQTDWHTAGFLSGLQRLELSGGELNAWACIPLIFRLPHRKLLKVDITMYSVRIGDDVLEELVQLVNQGIELDIHEQFTGKIVSSHLGKVL
jgi:hypothetical protein